MVKEEIMAGLRNALDRGEGLENAKQTMINAGYNINEINEASKFVDQSVIGRLEEQKKEQQIISQNNPMQQVKGMQFQQITDKNISQQNTPTQNYKPLPVSDMPQNQQTRIKTITQAVNPPVSVNQPMNQISDNNQNTANKRGGRGLGKGILILLVFVLLFLLVVLGLLVFKGEWLLEKMFGA